MILQPRTSRPGLAAFLIAAPLLAQNWVELGQANIDGNADHDQIRVNDRQGLFRAIRFRAENGAGISTV
jgi:hypothetical protein